MPHCPLLYKLSGTGVECRTGDYRDYEFKSGLRVRVIWEFYIPPTAGTKSRCFCLFDELERSFITI